MPGVDKNLFWLLLLTILVCVPASPAKLEDIPASNSSTSTRDGKVFSLFSVVQFKNVGCKSQSAMTSGQSTFRNGTCFTASECTSKGGTASGNCASGFGVCCLFLVTSTGATISQNCTYLQNPSFPSAYSGTGALSYTISKCSADVCWIRLDFETFQTLGPATTTEATGCIDTLTMGVSTTPASTIPVICGSNAGQHVYLDLGNVATDTATLAFAFTGTSTTRLWDIKVSQISCNNPNRPPSGCLQYYTTLVGRITSFNFKSTTSSHLWNQDQNVCIRRADGYCCIQYQVCGDQTNPFTLDRKNTYSAPLAGLVENSCTVDYIAIPTSMPGVCTSGTTTLLTRYCGTYLGLSTVGAGHSPICDCSAPFFVNIHTNGGADPDSGNAPASRGVCLDFMQVPCSTN